MTGPAATEAATPVRAARRAMDIAFTILAVVLRAAVLTVVCLLLWAALPRVAGWIPTSVVSGSMAPSIRPGDVVVAMPLAGPDVVAGQVVLVDDPAVADGLLVHRVQRVDDDGLVLRGDANPTVDRLPAPLEAVRGVGTLRVPVVGLPVVWIAQGDRVALAIGGASVLAVVAGILLTRRYLVDDDGQDDAESDAMSDAGDGGSDDCGTRDSRDDCGARVDSPPNDRDTRHLVRRVASVGVVAVLTTGLSTTAGAAFTADTANTADSFRTADYGCFTPDPTDAVIRFDYDEADHGTGTVRNSGTGPDGELVGGASRIPGDCAQSPAVRLDGVTGQIATGASMVAPDTFTIETWFRTTRAGGKLIGFGSARTGASGAHDRHAYIDSTGHLVFGVWANGQAHVIRTAQPVTDGRWHHVVGTMASTEGLRLVLDGTLVGTNGNTDVQSYTGWWRIGYDTITRWPGTPEALHFAGDLDGTRVFLRVVTLDEAADRAASGPPSSPSG